VWTHEPLTVVVEWPGGRLDFGQQNGFVSLGFTGLTVADVRQLGVVVVFEKRIEVRP
jgi:hypothetical protein